MKKIKTKKGFLITCVSCIVLLFIFCYFSFDYFLKGTKAASNSYDSLSACQSASSSCYYDSDTGKYYDSPYYDSSGTGSGGSNSGSTGGSGGSGTGSSGGSSSSGSGSSSPNSYDSLSECQSASSSCYYDSDTGKYYDSPYYDSPGIGSGGSGSGSTGGSSSSSKVTCPEGTTSTADGTSCVVGENQEYTKFSSGLSVIVTTNADGTVERSLYNEDGKLMHSTTVNEDGVIIGRTVTEYDSSGLTKIELTTSSDETEDGSYIVTQTNADGTKIERYYNADGDFTVAIKRDADGNYISQTIISSRTVADDDSYKVTIEEFADGSKIERFYDANGNLLASVVYTADGKEILSYTSDNLDGTTLNNLLKNDINYYMYEESCTARWGEDGCNKLDSGLYVPFEQAAKGMIFETEEDCESTLGVECSGDDEIGYVSSEYCDCKDDDSCEEPYDGEVPTVGDDPTIVPPSTYPDDEPDNPPSNPPSDPSDEENVTQNPQTSEIIIFVVWIIALAAIVYSSWYLKKMIKS